MTLTIDIPDAVAEQMTSAGKNLPRAALEGLALQGYRDRSLSQEGVRRLLGFDTSLEVHAFLAKHCVDLNYSMEDWQHDCKLVDGRQDEELRSDLRR